MEDPIGKAIHILVLLAKPYWREVSAVFGSIIGWFSVENNFFLIKTFGLFLSFILFIIILVLIKKTGYLTDIVFDDLRAFWLGKESKAKKKKVEWKRIKRLAKVNDKEHLKLAIIEADRVLDSILKEMGYEGESVFEKLEKVEPGSISDINGLKRAHRFRNRLVHESDFKFSLSELRANLAVYEQAFRELGFL